MVYCRQSGKYGLLLRCGRRGARMIVKNDTKRVVCVKNGHFQKEIAIGDSVRIFDEEIAGDYDFAFSFFSLKKEKRHSEVKTGRGLRGLDIWLETESNIPLTVKANAEGCERLTLREKESSFFFMYWKFRITNLVRAVAVAEDGKKRRGAASFCGASDRRRFLCRMAVEGMITLAVAIFWLFSLWKDGAADAGDFFFGSVGVCFLLSALRKLAYFFLAFRWKTACDE